MGRGKLGGPFLAEWVGMVLVLVLVMMTAVSSLTSYTDLEMEAETTKCLIREYSYVVPKHYSTPFGFTLHCQGEVTVDTCWGRCDSSEIADYKVPYKISNHPVCTYRSRRMRRVNLTDCHPDHPEPWVDVFDATECECLKCTGDHTSCENING